MENSQTILVLGSGQLGLMLAAAGARLGISVDRLEIDLPAHNNQPIAELLPGTSSRRFPIFQVEELRRYDLITAERELLPQTPLMDALTQDKRWQNPSAFSILPNRATQKQLLDELAIPTAPWCQLDTPSDLIKAQQSIHPELVIKITQGGYDGRGQWRIPRDQHQIPDPHFGHLIAEALIPFSAECSIIGARNASGDCSFLPLSLNHHDNGILRYSIAGTQPPALQPLPRGLQLQETAEKHLKTLMTHLDYVGVMAMECFITQDNLIINEIAPRVHNSGHWSQQGMINSQFDLHLLGLLNATLPQTQATQPTLMLNLIGCHFNPNWLYLDGVYPHWYGKSFREGRKLGHLNITIDDRLSSRIQQLKPFLDTAHQQALQQALNSINTTS